jgi:hypothetical protein
LPIFTTAGFVKRGVETGAGYATTRLMEKMPHTQPVPRLGMAQQFAGAGLKIVTDIAGMLGPFVLISERGEINSGRRGTWSS